jgi:hypothetical protein
LVAVKFRQLFKENFLWPIASQGYREVDGRGFGYFSNKDNFRRLLRKINIKDKFML